MPKKLTVSAKREEPFVKLSTRGATRLQARHPWVYRSDIVESNDPGPGSVVRVLDARGKFLGTALYSSSSQIAIRMLSHGSTADLPALVAERIRAAMAYRNRICSPTATPTASSSAKPIFFPG
jgi:23S rRNA (cytosine1962-C5)-methyltransferase